MTSMTVQNWKAVLKKRSKQVEILKDGHIKKKIHIDKVLTDGMVLFPKELYRIICSSMRYGKIYDKFLDKLWGEVNET